MTSALGPAKQKVVMSFTHYTAVESLSSYVPALAWNSISQCTERHELHTLVGGAYENGHMYVGEVEHSISESVKIFLKSTRRIHHILTRHRSALWRGAIYLAASCHGASASASCDSVMRKTTQQILAYHLAHLSQLADLPPDLVLSHSFFS